MSKNNLNGNMAVDRLGNKIKKGTDMIHPQFPEIPSSGSYPCVYYTPFFVTVTTPSISVLSLVEDQRVN